MLNESVKAVQSEAYQDRYEFDINDSIIRLRLGSTAELKISILDNELSYVEEGINARQLRPYKLSFDGIDIYDQEGNSMSEVLEKGEQWAASEITRRKAVADQIENEKLKLMMSGQLGCNTLVSFRPFPEESSNPDNQDELVQLGFQPERRLGFMSIYKRESESLINVRCISLDSTDGQIIRDIALSLGQYIPGSILTDEFQAYPLQFNTYDDNIKDILIDMYDERLEQKTGVKHRQGRPISQIEQNQAEINQFIKRQPELIDWYWQELLKLAKTNASGHELTRQKKNLTYSFWASIKDRYKRPEIYNANGREEINIDIQVPLNYLQISQEVWSAGDRAAARAEILIGCGSAMMRESLMDMDPDKAADFIFGDETDRVPSLLKCINPNCQLLSKKEEVDKGDCWQCPKCGIKAICGQVIYPNEKLAEEPKSEKKHRLMPRVIAQTALK